MGKLDGNVRMSGGDGGIGWGGGSITIYKEMGKAPNDAQRAAEH
jgi:hypothetical protein